MKKKISHIGILVHDLEAAIQFWTETFGFVELHRADIEAEAVRTAMISPTGVHGDMAIELIEPSDKTDMNNPLARQLARAGEGFFHIAIIDDDVPGTTRTLTGQGATMIERPPAKLEGFLSTMADAEACRQVIHPKSANGVLIELLQGKSR